MILHLRRYSYSKTETEGVLHAGDHEFATIECPWVKNPNGAPGGKPFVSCIPDGMYNLLPHKRPDDGDADHEEEDVWIIVNPQLGVYKYPQDHEQNKGRDLCLIHSANWADQLHGCIAPGAGRWPMSHRGGPIKQAVANSRDTMLALRGFLGASRHILSITNDTGASDV